MPGIIPRASLQTRARCRTYPRGVHALAPSVTMKGVGNVLLPSLWDIVCKIDHCAQKPKQSWRRAKEEVEQEGKYLPSCTGCRGEGFTLTPDHIVTSSVKTYKIVSPRYN